MRCVKARQSKIVIVNNPTFLTSRGLLTSCGARNLVQKVTSSTIISRNKTKYFYKTFN